MVTESQWNTQDAGECGQGVACVLGMLQGQKYHSPTVAMHTSVLFFFSANIWILKARGLQKTLRTVGRVLHV